MKRWGVMCLMFVIPIIASAQAVPKVAPAKPAKNLPNARVPAAAAAPLADIGTTPSTNAPSADFVKKFDQLTTLEDMLDQINAQTGFKPLEQRAADLANALRAQVPQGMLYDPTLHIFYTPSPTPAAPPPVPAAQPPAAQGAK